MSYADFAQEFMKQAGIIFKKYFYGNKETQYKKDTTPVTLADLEINDLLIAMVQKHFPEHAVMGEEGNGERKDAECIWICDPVDGTIPYSHNIPIATICLSLLKNGVSIFGVIYDPIAEKMYVGDGVTSTCNAMPLRVSQETNVVRSIVAIECFRGAHYNFRKLYGALLDAEIKVIQLCSIAYPNAFLASGDIIATIFPANHIREYAAAKPIIEGAGGKVTDLFGNEQNYLGDIHGHLATNGVMHDFFVDLIKKNVDL